MTITDDDVAAVRRFYAAFADRDLETMRACFTPDAVWYLPGRGAIAGEHRGWAAIYDDFLGQDRSALGRHAARRARRRRGRRRSRRRDPARHRTTTTGAHSTSPAASSSAWKAGGSPRYAATTPTSTRSTRSGRPSTRAHRGQPEKRSSSSRAAAVGDMRPATTSASSASRSARTRASERSRSSNVSLTSDHIHSRACSPRRRVEPARRARRGHELLDDRPTPRRCPRRAAPSTTAPGPTSRRYAAAAGAARCRSRPRCAGRGRRARRRPC